MKFVYNLYVLIIILRSARVVQSVADFTLDELKKLSRKLSPVECMRLIEAIYLAIPVRKEHRIIRETLANIWVSKHACLEELKAWNDEYPDKSEPRARVVMILHLNSLGRSDLANDISRNRKSRSTFVNAEQIAEMQLDEGNDRKKIGIVKRRVLGMDTKRKRPDHYPRMKRLTHGVQHGKNDRRSSQYNIRHPVIAAVAGGPPSNEAQAAPGQSQPETWNQATSKNSLFLTLALALVVTLICVIIYLVIRRSLMNSMCCCKRSDSHMGYYSTREKGLQRGYLDDDEDSFPDFETQSNLGSRLSEIDVEGGSTVNSVDFETRKSFSDPTLRNGIRTTPRVSVERLDLLNEEPAIEIIKEAQPLSSCRCRPLEPKVRGSSKPKKKKKKSKVNSKEETKTTKNYLKPMRAKIIPRQGHQVKKDCTFDMKLFQDKILAILNQECGVCQCCNCTSHWKADGSKFDESPAEHKEKKHKSVKLLKPKEGVRNEVLSYQTSVVSRSPMSAKRSHRKQESDSGKKRGIKNPDTLDEKCASSKIKRAKHREVILSSSSSEIEVYSCSKSKKDSKKSRKSKSKRRSKQGDGSAHTNKQKRFF